MMSSMTPFIVEPSMPTLATSARPSVSAKAVAAVRRGLRRELVDASFPTDLNGAPMMAPRPPTRGIDSAGPAIQMAATIPTPFMPPTMVRPLSLGFEAWSPERIASTGGMAPARAAGAQAASTVISRPATSGTMTAEGVAVRPLPGMSKPNAPMARYSSWDRPKPAATPSSDPTRPTMTASMTTEPVSWPRDAPSARSSANSLVRWATSMEKVLEMMNVPTSSPINPKATRK